MRLISQAAPARGTADTRTGPVSRLGGSLAAVVTPFRDGILDGPALAALCERQVRRGTAALVVCGSTGEAPALSPAEQAE